VPFTKEVTTSPAAAGALRYTSSLVYIEAAVTSASRAPKRSAAGSEWDPAGSPDA